VAVVLNVNARRVDPETVGWVQRLVPTEDLFLSRRPEDAPFICDRLVAERYDAVLFGGGDGTFAAGVGALSDAATRRGAELPDVGVLRFGTGNGLAHAVGAGPATQEGVACELALAKSGKARRRLQLLAVDGKPTMFAGFGLDAQILEDLGDTVDALERVGVAKMLRSAGARYFLAVASRSVPRFVLAQRAEVVAVNRGSPAVRVDVDGNPVGEPIPSGRVLWRGPASLAAASSIPYYGLALKMFPHAEREPGRFQVRLSDLGLTAILAHLPTIWKGRVDSPHVHDFLVDKVELVVSRPMPFQSGGDLLRERSDVTISLWPKPVAVV
jgi:diacylglycerol kinase family enzyme